MSFFGLSRNGIIQSMECQRVNSSLFSNRLLNMLEWLQRFAISSGLISFCFKNCFFPLFAENSFSRYRHFGGLPRNTFLSAIEKYKNGLIQFLTKIFNPSREKMKSFKVGSI